MRSQQQQQQRRRVPYHGAEEVNIAVRQFISETPDGALIPMSASLMILKLVEQGMIPEMAAKFPSQIRKGAPLYAEWKAAYASKQFEQKLGRAPNNSMMMSVKKKQKSLVSLPTSRGDNQQVPQQESQPRHATTIRRSNDNIHHQFWSIDPYDSMRSPHHHQTTTRRDIRNMKNNDHDFPVHPSSGHQEGDSSSSTTSLSSSSASNNDHNNFPPPVEHHFQPPSNGYGPNETFVRSHSQNDNDGQHVLLRSQSFSPTITSSSSSTRSYQYPHNYNNELLQNQQTYIVGEETISNGGVVEIFGFPRTTHGGRNYENYFHHHHYRRYSSEGGDDVSNHSHDHYHERESHTYPSPPRVPHHQQERRPYHPPVVDYYSNGQGRSFNHLSLSLPFPPFLPYTGGHINLLEPPGPSPITAVTDPTTTIEFSFNDNNNNHNNNNKRPRNGDDDDRQYINQEQPHSMSRPRTQDDDDEEENRIQFSKHDNPIHLLHNNSSVGGESSCSSQQERHTPHQNEEETTCLLNKQQDEADDHQSS